MDRQTFEQLENDYLADINAYNDVEWQLYDDRTEAGRNLEEAQNYIGSLLHDSQEPFLNHSFNHLMLELEGSYEDFTRLIRQKEDLLEEYRWESKKAFMEKTGEW